jgi:2-polyprenyl-3-methyl-5-hydroxy-6-metoxy-1,4-benzoquinol methylase
MKSVRSIDPGITLILKSAASFLKRHSHEKAIRQTFGYFTQHPIASLNQKRLRLILDRTEEQSRLLKRPLRILDLACGGGLITCALAHFGHRVLGVDFNPEEIRLAKKFAQEETLNGIFIQTDLIHNPVWERTAEEVLGGKPDIILLAYALHHIPNVEFFIDRLSRWMEPGSILLINEENPDSILFQLKHWLRSYLQKDTATEWHRTHKRWTELLERLDFQVLSPISGVDFLPWISHRSPELCWSLVYAACRKKSEL